MGFIKKVSKDWILTVLLFVTLATVSFTNSITTNNSENIKKVAESNNQFWTNFSDYMHCLVVPDREVYEALGKEKYFEECDKLLFADTGIMPSRTKITIPPLEND